MTSFDDDDLFTDLYGDDDSAPITATPSDFRSSLTARLANANGLLGEDEGNTSAEVPHPHSEPELELGVAHTSDSHDLNHGVRLGEGEGGTQNLISDNSERGTYLNPEDETSKEDGKMFIGGLNWDTTDESLFKYFSQFGEVTECQIMREATTGRSRGFAFLTFKDSKCVNTVMVKEHILDGKIIDPKRAIPKDEQEKTSKIFVGGVAPHVTEAEFRSAFSRFGRILDCSLMIDKDTGRSRGFGFITFESDSGVDNTLANCPLMIGGKMVEVKKAQPRGRDKFEQDDYSSNDPHRPQYPNYDENYNSQQDKSSQGYSGESADSIYGNGMTPSMLAQYWHRMQAYMVALQQIQSNVMRGYGAYGNMQAYGPESQASLRNSQAQAYYYSGRNAYDAPRFSETAVALPYEDENTGSEPNKNENSKPLKVTDSANDRTEESIRNVQTLSNQQEGMPDASQPASPSTFSRRQLQQLEPDSEADVAVTSESRNTPDNDTNMASSTYQASQQSYNTYQQTIPSGPRSYRSQYQTGGPPTGPRQGGYMYNRGRGNASRGRGGYMNRGNASGYFPYPR
ncbi:hypothetical protein V1509DRAFT_630140 [Lipomyces kononenkoae]